MRWLRTGFFQLWKDLSKGSWSRLLTLLSLEAPQGGLIESDRILTAFGQANDRPMLSLFDLELAIGSSYGKE